MKYIKLAFVAMVFFACNKASDQNITSLHRETEGEQQYVADSTASGVPPAPVNSGAAPPSMDWTRKIVKTANLGLELKDYRTFNTAVHQALPQYGAYVAHEVQAESNGEIANEMSIKVPVDRFESLMNYLVADPGTRVLQKEINTQDVTAEYIDTRSRIETRKQLRAKYYELLSQSKKMDEVLRVHEEINRITEDIEAASGRVEYLKHQAVYSTINLRFRQYIEGATTDQTPGFLKRFAIALREGAATVGDLFIAVAYLWPLLVLGVIAFFVLRRYRPFRVKA